MGRKRVVDVVGDIASKFCTSNGLELVDVLFVKEGPHRYLRVIIDKPEGVSLEDCGKLSQYLNKKLDSVDPIEEHYFLEVTSPGVERELKKEIDFARYTGQQVQAKLFQPVEGQKVIQGTLLGLDDGKISIKKENGQTILIPKSKAAVVKLLVTFE